MRSATLSVSTSFLTLSRATAGSLASSSMISFTGLPGNLIADLFHGQDSCLSHRFAVNAQDAGQVSNKPDLYLFFCRSPLNREGNQQRQGQNQYISRYVSSVPPFNFLGLASPPPRAKPVKPPPLARERAGFHCSPAFPSHVPPRRTSFVLRSLPGLTPVPPRPSRTEVLRLRHKPRMLTFQRTFPLSA